MPDYYADRPSACMDGWARRFLHVAPDGLVLPCHAAHTLPGLAFESVRDRPLARDLERRRPGSTRFRGEAWMPEPCRSCERADVDFGGCRCQAFPLTGDAAATDPGVLALAGAGIVERRGRARSPRGGSRGTSTAARLRGRRAIGGAHFFGQSSARAAVGSAG